MDQRDTHGSGARPLLADRIALAVAAAGMVASAVALALWWLLSGMQAPPSPSLIAFQMVLSPVLAGVAGWLVARRLVRASLAPAVEQLERFAAHDFSTPSAFGGRDGTAGLAAALESCRTALAAQHEAHEIAHNAWLADTEERARADAARQSAARIHAAVARLMGAAIGRLSNGDLTARINLDLPLHYAPVRSDFNAAMARLEEAFDVFGAAGGRLHEQGREIEEASALLMRRVGKLAERLDEDLSAIQAGGYAQDPERALRRLLYTMNGVQIATQRNAQAAARFADLGRQVSDEAERMLAVTRRFQAVDDVEWEDEGAIAGSAGMHGLPAAGLPASIGALALKLDQRPGE